LGAGAERSEGAEDASGPDGVWDDPGVQLGQVLVLVSARAATSRLMSAGDVAKAELGGSLGRGRSGGLVGLSRVGHALSSCCLLRIVVDRCGLCGCCEGLAVGRGPGTIRGTDSGKG